MTTPTPTPEPATRECSVCGETNPTDTTLCRWCEQPVNLLDPIQEADLR